MMTDSHSAGFTRLLISIKTTILKTFVTEFNVVEDVCVNKRVQHSIQMGDCSIQDEELMGPPSNVFFSTSAYFVNGNT